MMYQVIMRRFEYCVVNGRGVTCAGPYIIRHDALLAADKLNRRKSR
jgi:hypothetical protein